MDLAVVEICSDPINRSGISKKTGEEYNIWFQEAFLHLPGVPYPDKFEFLVRDGVVLGRGKFAVVASAFFVDRSGRLSLRLEDGLKPLDVANSDAAKSGAPLKAAA